MVGDDVQDDLHVPRVDGPDQPMKVFRRSQFRVDPEVVADAVRAADAFDQADRVNGHEPNRRHAQTLQFGQSRLDALEVPGGGEDAEIDLVDDRPRHPRGRRLYLLRDLGSSVGRRG